MDIDVYAICYNEAELLPFFMKHYSFARNIFIYDNYSTDESPRIAQRLGARVQYFGNNKLDDREYLKIKNKVYKKSNADYVIVCDLDEFIYHPNLINHLKWCKASGVQLPNVKGFNIYSEDMPKENILEIDTGFEDPNFAKQAIFSPRVNIKFSYGCHTNGAFGSRGGEVSLLHYRCIGGVNRMIDRHRMYADRMCGFNKQHKLGGHYFRSDDEIRKEWENNINRSRKLLFLSNESAISKAI